MLFLITQATGTFEKLTLQNIIHDTASLEPVQAYSVLNCN